MTYSLRACVYVPGRYAVQWAEASLWALEHCFPTPISRADVGQRPWESWSAAAAAGYSVGSKVKVC